MPMYAVGEHRLKAAVLVDAGLYLDPHPMPEIDSFNFVPRFRVPTLMVNGRFDFLIPLEASQRPMFRLLGAPEKDKRIVFWEGSHGDVQPAYPIVTKETLEWFDRYLGPVK